MKFSRSLARSPLFCIVTLLSFAYSNAATFAQEAPDAIFIVTYGQTSHVGPSAWNDDHSSGHFTRIYSGSITDTQVTANLQFATSGPASGSNVLGNSIQVLVKGKPSVTLSSSVNGNVSVSSSSLGTASAAAGNLPYNGVTASASKPSGNFPGTYTDSVSDSGSTFHDLGCGNGVIEFPEYPGVYYTGIPGVPIAEPSTSLNAPGNENHQIAVSANATVTLSVVLGESLPTPKISDPEVNGIPVSEAITGDTVTFHDDGSFDPDNDPGGSPEPGAGICGRQWTLIKPNGEEIQGGSLSSYSFIPTIRGKYTARLEVTDNEGDIDTIENSVYVEPPEPRGGYCRAGTGMSGEFSSSRGGGSSSTGGPGFLSGVVPGTGNGYFIWFDPVSTRGFPLTVNISINSQTNLPNLVGPMGNARFTYGILGQRPNINGTVYNMILDSDGEELNFGEFPGPISPAPGIFSALTIGSTTATLRAGPPGRLEEAGNFSYEISLASGRLLSITDPEGNVQTIQYDANNFPISVLDVSSGRSITFEYDTPGLIARIVEGQGAAVTHLTYAGNLLTGIVLKDSNQNVIREVDLSYNSNGLLSEHTVGNDPTSTVTFSYEDAGNGVYFANFTRADGSGSDLQYFEEPPVGVQYKLKRSNAQTGEMVFHVNSDGRITQKSSPAHNGASSGPIQIYGYTTNHKIQTVTNGATTITYTYNSLGKVQSSTVSGGQALTNTFAANGVDIVAAADQDGTFLTYTYGDSNNPHLPTTTGDGQGNDWTYSYNSYGQELSITPPTGSQSGPMTYTYEENTSSGDYGYLRSQTNGIGDLTLFLWYSPLGDLLSYATHPNFPAFNQHGFEYDPQRRMTQAWFDDASQINYVYDDHFLDSVIDENGEITSYEYEKSSGLLKKTKMPLNKSLQLQYDTDLSVSGFVDANANQTVYSYGNAGELTGEAYPDGHFRAYRYDDFGRLTEIENSAGHLQTLSYDSAGRVDQVDFANPTLPSVSYTYHPDGRYQTVTHEAGTETYTYDASRRVQKISRDFSASGLTRVQDLQYTYYPDDRVQTLTWKDGGATVIVYTYSYDGAGRLATISNSFGDSTTYSYDGEGKIVSQVNSNGTVTEYTYAEARNRISSVVHKTGGTPFESFSIVYDNGVPTVGNITQVTELDGSTVNYTYDSLYRLTSETRAGTTPYSRTYSYDLAGNLLTLNGNTFATYDTANKIATIPGGLANHDGIGNALGVSGTGLTTSNYSWGTRSELRSHDIGGTPVEYKYDASKRRVYRKRGTVERWYLFSEGLLIGEVDLTGASTAYTWGTDGLVSGRSFTYQVTRNYHFGPQGETRRTTDGTGAVVATYLYDAYGNTLISGETNSFRYGGKYGYYTDSPTDAMLATWRWYSPQLRRWLSRDPIDYDGGDNLYVYVDANPITKYDPFGLSSENNGDGTNREQTNECFNKCYNKCYSGTGGKAAHGTLLAVCPFISIIYPGNKELLGSKNKWTSLWSWTWREAGQPGIARAGKPVNRYANVAAVVAGGWVVGTFSGCVFSCELDCKNWA